MHLETVDLSLVVSAFFPLFKACCLRGEGRLERPFHFSVVLTKRRLRTERSILENWQGPVSNNEQEDEEMNDQSA